MADAEAASGTAAADTDEYRLLVAVGNPEHVPQLVRTATDLARLEGGSVHVVSVVHKPHESPFGIFDDATIREEFSGGRKEILDRAVETAEGAGVDVRGSVAVARRVSDGILETAEAVDADGILVGWQGSTSRTDSLLGSTVDALIERATCDVFVERIGRIADGVDSVLVPVAGSPHAELAVRSGCAIAAGNDANLHLVSVAAEGVDRATAEENVRTARRAMTAGGVESPADVDTRVIEADSVVDTLVEEADAHDVVAMGATRGGALRRRLVGSIPRAVTERIDPTVLLTRRWLGSSRLTRWLGRIRRSS